MKQSFVALAVLRAVAEAFGGFPFATTIAALGRSRVAVMHHVHAPPTQPDILALACPCVMYPYHTHPHTHSHMLPTHTPYTSLQPPAHSGHHHRLPVASQIHTQIPP